MSAELLRKAATILRARAEAASAEAAPPWTPIGQTVQAFNGTEIPTSPEDTREQDDVTDYIATMHPGVGLALADWLDGIAAGWPWDGEEPGVVDWDGDRLTLANSLDSHAVAVARLIVGEQS